MRSLGRNMRPGTPFVIGITRRTCVPAKTPPEVIAKINADTNAALVYASVKSRFEDLGAVPKGSTPTELAAFLQSEIAKWGPVIKDAQIKLEN